MDIGKEKGRNKSENVRIKWAIRLISIVAVVGVILAINPMLTHGRTNVVFAISKVQKHIPSELAKPQIKVPVDLNIERTEQKSVDAGHSPWKLDPAFVAQVFVSLKISPKGIVGDYPVKTKEIKIIRKDGKEAVVEISSKKTNIKRVYMKRLIRQDSTGIWNVVGYDTK